MSIFNQLIQSLLTQLGSVHDTKGVVRLSATLEYGQQTPDLLAWLNGQTHYPQMFWQQRQQMESFVALGAVSIFHQLDEAERFNQSQNATLVGGMQFEGKIFFFLPRLLLWKNQETLRAELVFKAEEHAQMQAFLAELHAEKAFATTQNQLNTQYQVCNYAAWEKNVRAAIAQIQMGRFDKVVLANATELTFAQPLSAYDLLAQSRQKNYGCYHFLWAENAQRYFIGSSPERLYRRQDRHFQTEALAGTVGVSENEEETAQNALWLLNDQKNRYENWLVVDDICDHLADCAGDIQVGEAHIKPLRNVQHLRRFIQTELSESVKDSDCLARIHPTAAVAGLPRTPAKQFIHQNEPFQRHWYAGTLGYFSPQCAEFCVTLRSAMVWGNQMTVYAGAGIVAESDPLSEWQEIERKALAMVQLIVTS